MKMPAFCYQHGAHHLSYTGTTCIPDQYDRLRSFCTCSLEEQHGISPQLLLKGESDLLICTRKDTDIPDHLCSIGCQLNTFERKTNILML